MRSRPQKSPGASQLARKAQRAPERSVRRVREHRKSRETKPEAEIGNAGGTTGNTGGTAGAGGESSLHSPYTVGASGFVTSGTWQGYAWVATEEPSLGSAITPADFTAVVEGDQLCVSGTVAPDPDYGGVAMLGMNLSQLEEGVEAWSGLWSPTGSGIEYAVTNNADSALRIMIQGALGYPDEAWCADARDATGRIPWTGFNNQCWDDHGMFYDQDGLVPLEIVAFLVPGDDSSPVPFDFCVNSVGTY